MSRNRRKRATPPRNSDPMFMVSLSDLPYPFNCTSKGLPFAPYRCSKCAFVASEEEPTWRDPSLPTIRTELTPPWQRYLICPSDEGPNRAQLLSPARDSLRLRVTHKICGRQISACVQHGVVRRAGRSFQVANSMSEEELLREVYLGCYVEDRGLGDDLDLEVLLGAPTLGRFRIGKVDGAYMMRMAVHHEIGEWETKVQRLSMRIQGQRPGFLGIDIARAIDPRRGPGAFARNQILFVPFNLSMPLQEQWKETLPSLDGIADYAYRFTRTKRPRRRANVDRDVYTFLSVKVEGRSVFAVAQEVFPAEQRLRREKKVRQIVDKVGRVVARAGIVVPHRNAKTSPPA